MHSRPILVAPRIVVNGSISVSWPICTSTSITVAAGSTMPTPASMCRSWIAACASPRTRASAARSLTPSTSRSSSTTCAATAAPSARSTSSTCGRYSSPCALLALSRGSAWRSACSANTKMPVFTSRISRSACVASPCSFVSTTLSTAPAASRTTRP